MVVRSYGMTETGRAPHGLQAQGRTLRAIEDASAEVAPFDLDRPWPQCGSLAGIRIGGWLCAPPNRAHHWATGPFNATSLGLFNNGVPGIFC